MSGRIDRVTEQEYEGYEWEYEDYLAAKEQDERERLLAEQAAERRAENGEGV